MKIDFIEHTHFGDQEDWKVYIEDLSLKDTEDIKQLFGTLNINDWRIIGRDVSMTVYALSEDKEDVSRFQNACAEFEASKEKCKQFVIDILKDERFNDLFI